MKLNVDWNRVLGRDGAGMSYEQVMRRKQAEEAMLAEAAQPATDVQSGLGGIVAAVLARRAGRQADDGMKAGREAASAKLNDLFGSGISGTHDAAPAGAQPMSFLQQGTAGGTMPQVEKAPSLSGDGSIQRSLARTESGGNWKALNKEGYGGRLQFGKSRLADAARAGLVPVGTTGADFSRMSPEVQQRVEQWHFNEIDQQAAKRGLDKYIGQTIGGVKITQDGIRAMAHLGGIGGAAKFLQSGGRINPADSNGTSLAKYAAVHAGASAGGSGPQAMSFVQPGGAGPDLSFVSQMGGGLDMGRAMDALNDPFIAETPVAKSGILGDLIKRKLGLETDPNAITPYQQAQLQMEQESHAMNMAKAQRDMASPGAGTRYSTTPVYGTDAQGNTVLGVIGDDGSFKPVETGGINVGKPLARVDTGTGVAMVNPMTGQIETSISKDIAGQQSLEAQGKAQGEAIAALPAAHAQARQAIQAVDSLLADPGLDKLVGSIQGRMPNWSEDAIRAQTKLDQIKGQAFLSARQFLKGQGAITDMESQRAEAAFNRLNTRLSEADFRMALMEFRQAVADGMAKVEAQAGMVQAPAVPAMPAQAPAMPAQAPAAPAPGERSDDDLLRMYGG